MPNGTAKKVHDEAVKPATKSVTLNAAWTGVQAGLRLAMSTMRMPAYAKGTDHHPGGQKLQKKSRQRSQTTRTKS